uniref:Uncharacterized protein n=1 Tax=Sphaerodactylus townsendi TaxID=933632 RepID=A0ACB8FPB4_9SAUR
MDPKKLASAIQNVSFDISIVSLVSLVWSLAVIVLSKKYKQLPHMLTTNLLIAQCVTCIGMVIWNFTIEEQSITMQILVFIFLYSALYSAFLWTGLLSLSLLLLKKKEAIKLPVGIIIIIGWGIPAILVGIMLVSGERNKDVIDSAFFYGKLQELGLGLSEEQVSEEDAHNFTDGFSLPALKVLFQLWVGQSSEFFRRLVLLLSPSNASPEITPESLPLRIFSDVTQGLPHAHAACLEELKRSYEFYRYFETHHQSGSDRLIKNNRKSRELNHLHTAVRSLQLHLKALLNEVIILEDELEKFVSSKESQEHTLKAYQVVEQKLKLIQPHMQASNSCWEEAISQVDKMVRRNPDKKDKPEMPVGNKHCTVIPLLKPAVHIADRDPIPEEQELEAYVDDTDIDSEYKRDDFYYFSLEDRERQKCEREESKRVLQELKSVLGFKASEAERQKWKQLLFSDHAAVKPLFTVEPEEPINISILPTNSDSGKQVDSRKEGNLEETVSDTKSHATDEDGRTEYLSDGPGVRQDDIAASGDSPVFEKRACYQCNGEGEESKPSEMDGVDVLQPPESDLLKSSIKQRLALLHISTDFGFTSGLAAQAAARSLTFTAMQEQTFGDEEEEIQESEVLFVEQSRDEVKDCENESL